MKIDKKIVGFKVLTDEAQEQQPQPLQMHEKVTRPEILLGSTYKIKTPLSEYAIYVTINDIVLNEGSEHEHRSPFEIFLNSKNMEHFQWTVALTRIISSVFRKGGDMAFLVDELKSVFDPKGGYFKRGGKYMPSLVAEIGEVIETHLKKIGIIQETKLDDHIQDQKSKECDNGKFPETAKLCSKCMVKALVVVENCAVCLNCGESKCQ